ncbi:Uncharacterised protein [uncultured archaeon]|nr:Uncharacterised protein [uncultured archaeon]
MVVIRNRLNQRLIVNLIDGKNIDLLAKSTAEVSGDELSSPHLQTLIAKGDISVIETIEEQEEETQFIKKRNKYKN